MCDSVVNVRNCKRSDYDVFIGRGGKWGNPYKIDSNNNREQVIEKFRQKLWQQLKTERDQGSVKMLVALSNLHGKKLGCYCAPKACHGDVLVRASEWAMEQVACPF